MDYFIVLKWMKNNLTKLLVLKVNPRVRVNPKVKTKMKVNKKIIVK